MGPPQPEFVDEVCTYTLLVPGVPLPQAFEGVTMTVRLPAELGLMLTLVPVKGKMSIELAGLEDQVYGTPGCGLVTLAEWNPPRQMGKSGMLMLGVEGTEEELPVIVWLSLPLPQFVATTTDKVPVEAPIFFTAQLLPF